MQIARLESGGIPGRHSHPSLKKDDSHGLFQINMLGTLGPARRKKYGLNSDDDLYDPETNARVAYTIFKGSGNRFDGAWVNSSKKLDDKGRPGFGPDNRGSDSGPDDGSSSNAQTDNPFKGGPLEEAYAQFLKTGQISDSTVSGLLKSGGTGAGNTGLSELFGSMAGGSTVNYGGVTFNITTPADNKSFIESIKKALGDLNLGKLIGSK